MGGSLKRVVRQRSKIMAGQEDEGWLFISEFGGRLDEGRFLESLKKVTTYAEISDRCYLFSHRPLILQSV